MIITDPRDPSRTVTDIDLIQGRILWEEKSPYFAADVELWVREQIVEKFARFLQARDYLDPFYRRAAIGFRFTGRLDPALRDAIEREIIQLQTANPMVAIFLDLGDQS